MPRKITPFVEGEYYHLYNHGIEGRDIFTDKEDIHRFWESMREFNRQTPVGSIYHLKNNKEHPLRDTTPYDEPLVDLVAYCLNPNHFHLIATPLVAGGLGEFIRRLTSGYTAYFNNKYKRRGVLFWGRTQRSHIDSDNYLIHCGFYVNLNNQIHKLPKSALTKSSIDEYGKPNSICNPTVLLGDTEDVKTYGKEAKEFLPELIQNKEEDEKYQKIFID